MLTSAFLPIVNYTYETTSSTMSTEEAAGFVAFMTAYMGFIIFIILASYIVSSIGLMKMFDKAGVPSWYAWVPYLNMYEVTKIAMGNGWLFLIMFIPSVGVLIWSIVLGIKLAAAFGKGAGIIVLTILMYPIAFCALGFGDAQYVGPQ